MKKILVISFVTIFLVTAAVCVLNIDVTTRQGINYQWHTIKLPLYLKLLNFFDRHYNYKYLVKLIIADAKIDNEKVMKIFMWTYNNIKETPKGLPVIDDHVWHIIIRGYGVDDQFSDVFTTLCNYAGIDAFYSWVFSKDNTRGIPLSFVRIKESWFVYDPYRGVYFKNKHGKILSIKELKSVVAWPIEGYDGPADINYGLYFDNLPTIDKIGLKRANTQSPWRRFMFEIKKWPIKK